MLVSARMALWDQALRQQIYLGDERFVQRMQSLADPKRNRAREVPRIQRSKPSTLQQWLEAADSVGEDLLPAHARGGMTMTAIAARMGWSVSFVSRLIARAEAVLAGDRGKR